ncbi:glycosyltransferase family 4 protein [Gluconacetobacter entanii]|uniref:Glycosyltransferase family 1 protein n=1 Tax=Gluconacetobacter entanii TaxID=108528 RepID=A0A318PZT2_9PROT|nr:glycosyltransferase family 4 protein [Gluconacetobacter entanii]MCE2579660.1 glycosyltransferase family 4 protein [Komagataeibacter sp. FNDCR1]PYD64445.1 glycosyltransferase family 1 protein [Gluconacetobacter entanii]
MKILEITNVDFALYHFLHPLMRRLRADGHDVVGACAAGPLLAPVRADGFRVEAVAMARSFSPVAQARALWALVRLIRRERPDIVHAHMPISGLLARLAAWLCGVPCVAYTCHGFLFNQPGPVWRRMLALVLEWLAGRVTDTYLTVSHEEARDARRLGIHRRATAIGNGRDGTLFRPDPATRDRVRAELGVGQGDVVIFAVSRLVRHKGYPELLAAMRDVPDAVLWVAGERLPTDHGPDMAVLMTQAQAELGPRLRCLGYRADVADLMTAADIFVLPSHFEGLPMTVIEAMLCGLPVVGSDIRGIREQIVTGRTGYLVPAGNATALAAALGRLVRSADLRHAMGAAGRARALAMFSQDAVLARTCALLVQGARRRQGCESWPPIS